MPLDYSKVTDTHLSKRYNDILFDCMMRANMTGYVNMGSPHYENLIAYYASINSFYINSFFLFETITWKDKPISKILTDWMVEIDQDIDEMKSDDGRKTKEFFRKVSNNINAVHKMIMYALQRRNMLVRMSDKEPRGADSINYWGEKAGFKKGNILSDEEYNVNVKKHT